MTDNCVRAQHCHNCWYFYNRVDYDGECRISPPVAGKDVGRVFPVVGIEDWCGKWESSPKCELGLQYRPPNCSTIRNEERA